MSFQAVLKVANKELNILNLHYEFSQDVDATGRPSSVTRGGRITVRVEATGDTTFFEWMTNNFERKDGSIVFYKRDSKATLKELKFKEAYLIDYAENFESTGSDPLSETLTFSAKEVDLGNAKFVNEWPKN